MDEPSLIYWIFSILIPIFISISTFWMKINKDKRENENRLTLIESRVDNHDENLKDIKKDLKSQNEDLKLLHKLNTQSDMMLKMMDEIKQDLRKEN
ncbi:MULTISPECIES: DUF7365 family protein [Staphylococcus]|uniref:DUF7365 family protein n=1 Tax=Staphylococcus TaxID=1279 RepID=UPI00059766EF|nr:MULTISPECIES: hypothetical protein [Staphylococcus]AMG20695.1 hypothetical protein AL528_10940 [Staphylococcus saprophyticus]KIJ86260.1 hypothetical protein SE00_09360 [Staphylococcus saprophyticus]MBN6091246.1 hypothetical protein [Staphylococcus saprophyticus]MBN6095434.1 hypothetical protein [Staphylococcus saprophyticus]MBN6098032.1 hypothetical protein [Staphylococcus saprophyticus]